MEHCAASEVGFRRLETVQRLILLSSRYLGDALVHFSIPLLLWGTPAFHPLELLRPLTNYFFLRYLGGDYENEASQEERYEKAGDDRKFLDLQEWRLQENSFWPALNQVKKPWLWS